MLKKLIATGIVTAFLGSVVLAADYDGVIMKIDTEKKTIKAKVKEKEEFVEKNFTYDDKTTFAGKVGKKGDKMDLSPSVISSYLETRAGKRRGLTVKFSAKDSSDSLTSVSVARKMRMRMKMKMKASVAK